MRSFFSKMTGKEGGGVAGRTIFKYKNTIGTDQDDVDTYLIQCNINTKKGDFTSIFSVEKGIVL